MENLDYDGWSEDGFAPTWRTRLSDRLLRALRCCLALWTLVTRWDNSDAENRWLDVAHRIKAAMCLVFGLSGNREPLETVSLGYFYVSDHRYVTISVGYGWSRWWVELEDDYDEVAW